MENTSLGADVGRPAATVAESLSRSKDALGNAASEAMGAAATDLEALRRDLNGLKDTLTRFMSQAGSEAVRSAQDVSSVVAQQGASVASNAIESGKSLAGELEDMTRRNPLGTVAGAVVVGMLIAALGRRR